jgi:hypothetical protein
MPGQVALIEQALFAKTAIYRRLEPSNKEQTYKASSVMQEGNQYLAEKRDV